MTTREWTCAVAFALGTFLAGPVSGQPLTSTLTEEIRIANPIANSFGFGRALAIDGDTMVIAAPQLAGNGIQRGVVNIYGRGAAGWVLQQTLTRSVGVGFGDQVAVSGDTLVVTTEYNGQQSLNRVPAVYVRASGVWTQQADLTHGDPFIGGERVAVAGDVVVVGTRGQGVYAFVRTGTSWAPPQRLRAESSTAAPFALDGNALLIGEPSETVAGQAGQGVAHLYLRDGAAWTEQAMLTLPDGRAGDAFGRNLAMHGDTALIIGRQRVWPFRRVSGQWTQGTAFDLPQLPSSFGSVRAGTVTLHGDTAVVIHATSTPYVVSYLFRRIGASWYKIAPIHPASSSYTPADIEVGDDRVFVGFSQFGNTSPYPDSLTAFPGQVFVYRVPNGLPPAAPVLTGSATSGSVSLSWTPGAGEPATSYVLEAGSSSRMSDVFNANIGPGLQLTATAPRGAYYIRVRGVNAMGPGDPSNELELGVGIALPPAAPTNLVATVTGTTASFTWSRSTSAAVTDYVVWAGSTPSVSPPLVTLPVGLATSYVATAVPPGTYYVFVQARNGLSASSASNVVTVTVAGQPPPGVPTLNTPVVSGSTVTLSWTAGSGGSPTGYTMTASISPGGAPIAVAPLTGSSASFADVPSGTYYVRLTASNGAGTSAPSAEVVVVVP